MPNRPNIVIVMVDQLTGTLFPDGPAAFLVVPNLRRLFAGGVRFANTYCPSPLCAPSRSAFMTGLLPSQTRVYDNAAEFSSSIPTFAHHLRGAGYTTVLSGKMHFVGPDQLHGFEERLTTDIYPADYGWTPNWSKPGERIDWWYHNLSSVTAAGMAEITNQLEFDDEVAFLANQRLLQMARRGDGQRPFCMTVSFTHPHDPFVARPKHWDLYPDGTIPPPHVSPIPVDQIDAHSRRLYFDNNTPAYAITERMVTDSRRAYCANISYVDDKIGELLTTLEACQFTRETIIVFCSDHGEMLGERGMWFKMNFFEGSARVPLLIHAPERFSERTVTAPVSTTEIMPFLLGAAGVAVEASPGLAALATGEAHDDRLVVAEYAAEGSIAPMIMLRRGRWKFVHTPVDPDQLFDLAADPHELTNMAAVPAHRAIVSAFRAEVAARLDIAAFDAAVRTSQTQRHLIHAALRHGRYFPWDFQPLQQATERYMRNHMDLNVVESDARFPKQS
jgi:choline-sulfatase